MVENRRKDNRTLRNLRARWAGISGQREARIGDIGLGGCYVDSMSRVQVGETIELEVELPSGEWLPLRGKVTSCQEAVGFGIQFSSLTDSERAALEEVLS
jgi:hypothetical protein